MCVCVCVCACVRACVRGCVCVTVLLLLQNKALGIWNLLMQKYGFRHCIKICEIRRYTALSNSLKCPCNTPFFFVSGLLQKRSLNQFGYGEIRRVTRTSYSVRQCNISLYFTYLYAVWECVIMSGYHRLGHNWYVII